MDDFTFYMIVLGFGSIPMAFLYLIVWIEIQERKNAKQETLLNNA